MFCKIFFFVFGAKDTKGPAAGTQKELVLFVSLKIKNQN